MTEILTIEGGQKDALLKRVNIKKYSRKKEKFCWYSKGDSVKCSRVK